MRRHDQKKVPFFLSSSSWASSLINVSATGFKGLDAGVLLMSLSIMDQEAPISSFVCSFFFFTQEKGADTSTAIESAEE